LTDFSINIIGLGNKLHQFEYEFGDDFFASPAAALAKDGEPAGALAKEGVLGGQFTATVLLDKHETFLEAAFKIRGQVTLACDRSLEAFDHLLKTDKKIVFKYGDEAVELSDEIVVIPRDLATLNLGHFVYEFVVLSLPMKRLHPKFGAEDDDDDHDGKMVWSSSTDGGDENDVIDPRWEKLKKLK
jgi:uncharacterized protein